MDNLQNTSNQLGNGLIGRAILGNQSKGVAATSQNTPQFSLGVRAASPAQNVKPPTTTLTKAQTAPSLAANQVNLGTAGDPNIKTVGQNTSSSTQSVPAYGSTYDPTTGKPTGVNQYDPNTGKALYNPQGTSADNQTQTQLEQRYNNQNPQFTSAVNGLAGANLANSAITNQTQNEVNATAQNIAQLRQNAALNESAYNTGMIAPRAQGLAQNVAQTEAAQEAAQQGQLNNELQAGQQALTGQAQTQSAQQSAGSLSAPQVTSYGQTSFNPTTGQFDGGGSLPTAVLQQYAQMAANGQYSAIPSTITQNPVLSAQLNAAAQQINPNYNPIASTAQGATQAANIQTLGTTPVTTNAQIGASNQTAAANLSTQLQQFANLGTTANNFLQSNLGLNPTQIPSINQSIGTYLANIKNPGASAAYSLISNDIRGLQQAILGSYGSTTPTAAVEATLQTDPSTLPVNQLQTWISTLNQLGSSRLAPLQSTATSAYGSGTTPYSGTPTTADTSAPTVPGVTAGNTGITPLNSDEAAAGFGMGLFKDIEGIFSKGASLLSEIL